MHLKQSLAGGVAGVLAAATMLWAGSAAAVTTDGNEIPYLGAGYNFEIPDSARHSDDGQGAQFTFGVPLATYGYERWAAETTLHMLSRDRHIDGKSDYQTGLLFDLVYDFDNQSIGNFGGGYQFKPFALGGVGIVQNDVRGDRHEHFGVDLGGGVLLPLGRFGWKGLAARVEARALGQVDSQSTSHNFLIDYRITAGLQLPLFFLFNNSGPAVAPAQECELAVVDPVTGRSDCGVDSDRDGVTDAKDLCPGTPTGTGVDASGCPMSSTPHPGDDDADGVPNEIDRCPGTRSGLQVDASGCMVSQSLQLPGVQFDNNTAVLTDDARKVLKDVASTLKNQPNVAVQIGGNTDNVGNKAYNLMLSQQRAESVRQYLVAHGVDAARLVATGFGDFHPVASNSTEEGRAKNRRVDFKLIVE
ncbi:OmpA family protein [Solimonas terrae]|uniref:OmpA family protein n=1 Tax=Solimonas terrae TaxID=1396819 RepID=A0A6M2BUR8_9GAMM|nr:OmpA family protein [Solimonas terrae]NGY06336.1 OmpA family protein [Solimonas terrae]